MTGAGCAAEAAGPAITAARLALSAMMLPSLVDALAIGDRVRMALSRCSNGHPVSTGHDVAWPFGHHTGPRWRDDERLP